MTARARIRDVALRRFGTDGFAATTIRAVAADAGVSPALVVHHFGSKEGLRAACDEVVLAVVREKFDRVDAAGGGPAGMGSVAELAGEAPDLVRYLSRAVVDGGPQADQLVDALVAESTAALAAFTADGHVLPTADPPARAALLVVWELAVLVMAPHLARTTGSDPLTEEGMQRFSRAALEVYTHGLFTDSRWLEAFDVTFPRRSA